MPVSFAFIFRAVVCLALATHVFYMYCTARGMNGSFGFSAGATIIACLFALAMLLPFVWAVFLPDLPVFLSKHLRPRRRWRRGQCPNCGYDRMSLPLDSHVCPECGGDLREPDGWLVSVGTVQRFVAINLLAWSLGCVAGESWMQRDERAFRREVQARSAGRIAGNYARERRWPNQTHVMVWIDGPNRDRGTFAAGTSFMR